MMGDCEFRIEDCLAQIDMLDPGIGAWEFVDSAGARQRARELDAANTMGPLHGMAIGIKDVIDVKGMPTTNGSPIYSGNIARMDAACVALARTAGGIIIGKTVTTELATFVPSRTKNPQNPGFSPGGSSAGSAAAVSGGMVPLAFGTQTAGSVIRPAAFCGVVGFKPTFGFVPRSGVKLQSDTLDTVGVFARTIDDAHRWYLAMAGAGRASPLPAPEHTLRISLVANLMQHADVEMSVAIAQAAEAMTAAGIRVREVRLPGLYDEVQADQRIVQLAENARHYRQELHHHRSLLSTPLASALDEGEAIDSRTYGAARARLDAARKQVDYLFSDCDAWLMPSACGAAPRGLDSTGDPVFNRLATALHLPALNLPVYRNKQRMPLGLQLIGPRHQDEKLLALAGNLINVMRGIARR
jgi:amidase